MKWNTHQDMKNRAYAGILTTLFPEQTKSVAAIVIWSIILIVDLIIGGVVQFNCYIDLPHMFYNMERMLNSGMLLIVGGGLFLTECFIWNTIARLRR